MMDGSSRSVLYSSLLFIRVVLVKKMVPNSEVLVDLLDTDFRPISWSIPYDGSPYRYSF